MLQASSVYLKFRKFHAWVITLGFLFCTFSYFGSHTVKMSMLASLGVYKSLPHFFYKKKQC
jgi:hypothetical protein